MNREKKKNPNENNPNSSEDSNLLFTKLQDIITNSLEPVMVRLNELENNSIASASTNTQTSIGTINQDVDNIIQPPITTSTGYVIMSPPTKPQFSGRGTHPVSFINDLERYCARMKIQHNDIESILECLTSHAKYWSSLHEDNWKTITDFKNDFLKHYWGKDVQNKIKRRLHYGRWTPNSNKTMSEYFVELYSDANKLTAYSSKEAITEEIMGHFPSEVQRLWIVFDKEGPIEANMFLRSIEFSCLNESNEHKVANSDTTLKQINTIQFQNYNRRIQNNKIRRKKITKDKSRNSYSLGL